MSRPHESCAAIRAKSIGPEGPPTKDLAASVLTGQRRLQIAGRARSSNSITRSFHPITSPGTAPSHAAARRNPAPAIRTSTRPRSCSVAPAC
ncbi:DUF6053 domain-containing protein [Lysobacter capsici]|uniref:DUF6053 domain-containing protein n=1 Tax=Lysobacter capsici TaxID=435897 RepID=UPI003D2F948E